MSMPYPIEINDTPTMLSRAQSATDFQRMILDQFEEMLRLSQNQPLVFGISMHTFCTGQPFRLAQVRQALQLLMKHRDFQNVWVTKPGENRRIRSYAASRNKMIAILPRMLDAIHAYNVDFNVVVGFVLGALLVLTLCTKFGRQILTRASSRITRARLRFESNERGTVWFGVIADQRYLVSLKAV